MTVTDSASYPEAPESGSTMDGMPTPAHAKPASRDRLLWIVAVIAAFALYDVWGAWTEVGDKSGFAHGTGWTLTVIVEAFGICALVAWLADAPGPRSRRFAMWSAVIVFALSLIGQASSHLTARSQVPPAVVVVFVSVLPVIVLALGAVLIHLRIKDRAEHAETDRRDAVAEELAALRAEITGAQEALSTAQADRVEAEAKTAEVLAKVEVLTRKLARTSGRKSARKSPAKSPASTQNKTAASTPEVQVPEDVDTQAAALEILAGEPGISGSELGRRLGKSERYGCMLKNQLTGSIAGPDSGVA